MEPILKLGKDKCYSDFDLPCRDPKSTTCYPYICAKTDPDPKSGKCIAFTNTCECGTDYNDDTVDQGKPACCWK